MSRDKFISLEVRELDTVIMGLEINKCMKQTFLRNSQPLRSFVFDEAYSSVLLTTANH